MNGRKWSKDDDVRLIIFSRYGWDTSEIAEYMQRSFNDVSQRRDFLRCNGKREKMSCGDKLTNEQIADIIYRYYQQEQSMATISRETGISYTTVRRHVNEYWRKEQHKRK